MGIHSANKLIREARQKVGLTQAQMSEGICSVKVLSRIETGFTNVSHVTFQALMDRAGSPVSAFPVFNSRDGFKCFYALKRVHLYLNAWQLVPAREELQKLEDRNWTGNKLYYQEWLLLHGRLQFCSYRCSHEQNFRTLLEALHITRPEIDLLDFRRLLLSQNEIRILTSLAQEALYLGKMHECLRICGQVADFLADSKWPLTEKERLQADNTIVCTKYLIATGSYESALETVQSSRHKMALNAETAPLLELTFLTGLCCYHTGNVSEGEKYVKAAFYSAYALESCYATVCRDYLRRETAFPLTGEMGSRPDIPLHVYPAARIIDSGSLSGDCYDTAADSYSLGNLIQDLRREQKISQSLLCQGLCTGSRLSKIENGSIEPDIMLSEALLQRLGFSDRVFAFWGSEKEKRLHDLKYKIMYERSLPPETLGAYLNEMEQLISEKDVLYRQEYLFLKTIKQLAPGKRIAGLTQALLLTLPEFKINEICSYRLTWCELTILNNLAHEYRLTEQSYLCSVYVSPIIAYMQTVKPDILFQKNILPFTYSIHCRTLYLQKLYKQTLDFADKTDESLLKYNIGAYSIYLFFYSQILGECDFLREAATRAINACAIDEMLEYLKNPKVLKKYFIQDFSIVLDY